MEKIMGSKITEMSAAPLITVMIPCFNQAPVIERALESVLQQSYKHFEVIISDDCSNDNTREVVTSFIESCDLPDHQIRYFRNEVNLGYLQNYHHTLFTRARGDWTINLDGDDFFIDNNFFQNAVSKINHNPTANLLCANYKEFHSDQNTWIPVKNNLPPMMSSSQFLALYGRGEVLWNHNALLYKTSTAIKIGFYWDKNKYKNDWESFLKLATTGDIIFYDSYVSAWVQHSNNLTGGTSLMKFKNNFFLIQGLRDYMILQDINIAVRRRLHFYLIKINIEGPATLILRKKEYIKFMHLLLISIQKFKFYAVLVLLNPVIWLKFFVALNPSIYFAIKKMKRRSNEL